MRQLLALIFSILALVASASCRDNRVGVCGKAPAMSVAKTANIASRVERNAGGSER